jgi:deoxyribodipyrimidine photo-lyase
MNSDRPIIYLFRRDLRLGDHVGLSEVSGLGRPVIPVFILDEIFQNYGAAPKWRLGLALASFSETLEKISSKLTLRLGQSLSVINEIIKETGANEVHWTRAYDPAAISRDKIIKTELELKGLKVKSHEGHLLFEPWRVKTKIGGFYKIYTPYWNSVRDRYISPELPKVEKLQPPKLWPISDELLSWGLSFKMNRGADVVFKHTCVGEDKARDRLQEFISDRVMLYKSSRDFPSKNGTSGLAENLTYGEISIRSCWLAAHESFLKGQEEAEVYLKELVWREFSYHLAYYTPHMLDQNWRDGWNKFPWTNSSESSDAWCRGKTGVQLVDAAMREMYVTGTMHNRGRMIVASYLTKNLMTHWKVGADWFSECLIDWDPAANAMGWQWAAGSGPDASPYFRIFNPDTQAEKFDKNLDYRIKFLAEVYSDGGQEGIDYFRAIPRGWNSSIKNPYPEPFISLADGRAHALRAYSNK